MSSLHRRVAQLALGSEGWFRDQLVAALRSSTKLADSKLPEEVADNQKGEPTDTKRILDRIQSKKATLDRRSLDSLVFEQAEMLGLPHAREAKATSTVMALAGKFTRAVSKALAVYVQKFPPMGRATAGDLMDKGGAYLVYNTLNGRAGGINAGAWDEFYEDIAPLERVMLRAVARDYQKLKDSIVDAALETAGGE